MRIIDNRVVSVLSDDIAQQIKDFGPRLAMRYAGYDDPAVGYPPMAEDWAASRKPESRAARCTMGTRPTRTTRKTSTSR